MSHNIKRIIVDLNNYCKNENHPIISPFVIDYFELKAGDIVIGFQDDQEWEGIIGYDSELPEEKTWYLDITDGKEYVVSNDRMVGRSEGGRASMPYGEMRGEISVVTAMIKDGVGIDDILKYTRLSKSRIINMMKMINK